MIIFITTILGLTIPNHHRPWTSFHTDALFISGTILFCLIHRSSFSKSAPASALKFSAIISTIIFIQYLFAEISLGHMLTNIFYISCLGLSIWIGSTYIEHPETNTLRWIYYSFTLGSLISVALQLLTILDADIFNIIRHTSSPGRPSGNIGQSNMLGTILIIGLIGLIWLYEKNEIRASTLTLAGFLIILGVVLTGSRAAILSILFSTALIWRWREHIKRSSAKNIIFTIIIFLTTLSFARPIIIQNPAANESYTANIIDSFRLHESSRIDIWNVFISSIQDRALFGWGWNHGGEAYLNHAKMDMANGVIFTSAHNIFLDLIVWLGLPIGLTIILFLTKAAIDAYKSVENIDAATSYICLAAIAIHSFFELPLHYGYILIPTGIFIGITGKRINNRSTIYPSKFPNLISIYSAILGAVGCLIVYDYPKVEENYRYMILHQNSIKTLDSPKNPEAIIISQWNSYFDILNSATNRITENEIENTIAELPDSYIIYYGAQELVKIGKTEKALIKLRMLCRVLSTEDARRAGLLWNNSDAKNIYGVKWNCK